ncbi:oxidoreductase [Buchnera aphidicola (Nipponaphis monzeni)]|uniref:Heme chaperone HemW n=1 Tax=Buchnera aphidicola (Nipponaphis monzeni) TaxID=2495405 RepID=A0A455TAV4_9GAMM|nr:radical SAM family heme chaperone HemW [Buchnera aphidicola]BBI01422.1 oxidoreductase [Buchnera aphidicola (Nipponaphis monzeni)]
MKNNTLPLSLYIHIPWCIKKCFYCDFHSFVKKDTINEKKYINHLLKDLSNDIKYIQLRTIHSIFIGGGTPSLFSSHSINFLIQEIKKRIPTNSQLEITIESNPNSFESNNFYKYKKIGINRLSIGVQTFNMQQLQLLGRTYSSKEANKIIHFANKLHFKCINLDLMHCLPNQSVQQALKDLIQITTICQPQHISWYQLSIEKNTFFYSKNLNLPNENTIFNIINYGEKILKKYGYYKYEISSYSKIGYQCQHNLNYWRFGDYIGIGCGAHGKITTKQGEIIRTVKSKKITDFINGKYLHNLQKIKKNEQALEFFMNRFRLIEPTPKKDLYKYTQLTEQTIQPKIQQAISEGFLKETKKYWETTSKGKNFLNSLLEIFI